MKKLLLYSILGLIAGILFSLLYDGKLNLYQRTFLKAAKESDRWNIKLRGESDAPCYVFTAGSQVREGGIFPKVMYDEFGVRAINAGASAGYGLSCNTSVALKYLQPGDYLFVETRYLGYSPEALYSTGGVKYCFQVMGVDMFKSPYIHLNSATLVDILMGEAGEMSMFFVTAPLRVVNYMLCEQNEPAIIHESGWCESRISRPLKMVRPPANMDLTEVKMGHEFREYLNILKAECKQRGVHLRSFMHVAYIEETAVPHQAMVALKMLEEGIPVLKDPTFGCESDLECFSDSINHMTLKGAKKYSRIFARSIVQNEYWTKEELEAILAQHGYAPDGTRQEAIK